MNKDGTSHSRKIQGLLTLKMPASMADELAHVFDAGYLEGEGEAEISACPYEPHTLAWMVWTLGAEMGATA